MKLTKVAIFCLLLALTVSIASSKKVGKSKRKRRLRLKTTRKPLTTGKYINTTTANPGADDTLSEEGSARNEAEGHDFQPFKEEWKPPMDTRCCYFLHPCPVMRAVNHVKRVFTPHFWKRGYHLIVHKKDIGACDPSYCECYKDDEKHGCDRNEGYRCPCYEQFVERTKNQKKT